MIRTALTRTEATAALAGYGYDSASANIILSDATMSPAFPRGAVRSVSMNPAGYFFITPRALPTVPAPYEAGTVSDSEFGAQW